MRDNSSPSDPGTDVFDMTSDRIAKQMAADEADTKTGTDTGANTDFPTPPTWRLRLFAGLATVFFAIGLVGAFLPLLPTTVFWIIACYFALRANPKLRERMMRHKTFGPGLRLWFEHGAIQRRAKMIACASMLVSLGIVTALIWGKWVIVGIIAATLACVAIWLCTRPEGPTATEGLADRIKSGR